MAVKLTKKAFREWLQEQEGVVGRAGSLTSCPLAMYYLHSNADIAEVGVEDDMIDYVLTNGRSYYKKMPKWGYGFVNKIDDYAGDVTAEQALEVLNNG